MKLTQKQAEKEVKELMNGERDYMLVTGGIAKYYEWNDEFVVDHGNIKIRIKGKEKFIDRITKY